MSEKIRTIVLTLFMLMVCTMLLVFYQYISAQNRADTVARQTEQAIISLSGEISDNSVTIDGLTLISSLDATVDIDKKSINSNISSSGKSGGKIYDIGNNGISNYLIYYNGSLVNSIDSLRSTINSRPLDSLYNLVYDISDNSEVEINITNSINKAD